MCAVIMKYFTLFQSLLLCLPLSHALNFLQSMNFDDVTAGKEFTIQWQNGYTSFTEPYTEWVYINLQFSIDTPAPEWHRAYEIKADDSEGEIWKWTPEADLNTTLIYLLNMTDLQSQTESPIFKIKSPIIKDSDPPRNTSTSLLPQTPLHPTLPYDIFRPDTPNLFPFCLAVCESLEYIRNSCAPAVDKDVDLACLCSSLNTDRFNFNTTGGVLKACPDTFCPKSSMSAGRDRYLDLCYGDLSVPEAGGVNATKGGETGTSSRPSASSESVAKGRLSTGAKAGIGAGAGAVVLLIIGVLVFLYRRRKQQRAEKKVENDSGLGHKKTMELDGQNTEVERKEMFAGDEKTGAFELDSQEIVPEMEGEVNEGGTKVANEKS